MRRALSCMLTAAPFVGATRTFYFSEGSPKLKAAQKEKGYKSNLWFRTDELKYAGLTPRQGEKPTDAMIVKQLELLNFDELDGELPALEPTDRHTSFSTKKPYGQQTAFELEGRATLKGLKSHWWIHPQSAKKMGLRLKPRARSTLLLMSVNDHLFNVDQFEDPEKAKHIPFSGGTRRIYGRENATILQEYLKRTGAENGLFFTEGQMKSLLLEAKPDAQIVELPDSNAQTLYNVMQVEDGEAFLTVMNAGSAAVPTFATGGALIKDPTVLANIEKTFAKFNCNWYVTSRDVEAMGSKLLPGEEGIPFGVQNTRLVHVSQLADPAKGYEMCGRLTR